MILNMKFDIYYNRNAMIYNYYDQVFTKTY